MTAILYEQPIEVLVVLVTVVFVGLYWVGCVALRPLFRVLVRSQGGDNEIVGSVLAAFGVLYGLLMSLIAVAAYQNLNDVESQVEGEASSLLSLFRVASDYPDPLKSELQSEIRNYCQFIIQEEWPIMRSGKHPRGAQRRLEPIFRRLIALEHETVRDEVIQNLAVDHFDDLADFGRRRRFAAEGAIPTAMWYVVFLGTLINFGLMWSFDMRFISQLFLGGMLAFFLGALILLIAVLERPYRSLEFGVSPEAFELVHEVMLQDSQMYSTLETEDEEP